MFVLQICQVLRTGENGVCFVTPQGNFWPDLGEQNKKYKTKIQKTNTFVEKIKKKGKEAGSRL